MALDRGRDVDRYAVLGLAKAADGVEALEREADWIAAGVAGGADLVVGMRHQPLAQGLEWTLVLVDRRKIDIVRRLGCGRAKEDVEQRHTTLGRRRTSRVREHRKHAD